MRSNNQLTMKNHLIERLISAIWLGLLGYLFVYSLTFFPPNLESNLFIFLGVVVSIFYVLFGFFRGYKNLLLPADTLDTFPIRCVAGIWFGSLTCFTIMGINSLVNDRYAQITSIVFIPIALIAFLIGWLYFYRLLLIPKVNYLKLFPSLKLRVIAAIWFGIIGYLLALIIIRQAAGAITMFVLLLASYLGFTTGYRILLLPTSLRGTIKSIMLGFIGTSYALLIVFLIFLSGMFSGLLFTPSSIANSPHANLIGDSFGASFTLIFVIFPLASLFICGIGIFFALMLYLISRPWAKN